MLKQEFDEYAESYYDQHAKNIRYTGQKPDFFAEYKIEDLHAYVDGEGFPRNSILDFGSGIGNSIPYFRKYFNGSNLCCADVSVNSIEVARENYGERESYMLIEDCLPVSADCFDIVFSACVFHHIDKSKHLFWLGELFRVLKPGGVLVIYEHNPKNILTVRAVNTCPFDKNAELITAGSMMDNYNSAGFKRVLLEYKLFIPLSGVMPGLVNNGLKRVPYGAQYRVSGVK